MDAPKPKKRKLSHDGSAHNTAAARSERRQALEAERKELPVWAAKDALLAEVRANRALIVVGETGSGKTTQIPRMLMEAGLARGGMVACTQPRRVAAITVARRVAEEMGVSIGGTVGYTVRFEDQTSEATRIKYMTDGMLLREALLDPLLRRYKVVLLDEAHERTVNTDVLLGLLKGVLGRRPNDFRLIVMSATLNAAPMSAYFGDARIAYVKGRQFPVEVFYAPQPEDSYMDAALNTVLQVHADQPPGDILVFLTGQEEIEALARLVNTKLPQLQQAEGAGPLLVAPIYASLPAAQQLRVFEPAPAGTRKVIIATNIAETSITVKGVRYVVDAGFVKARGYHASVGVDSLQVVPVSQAQARQRAGRAGRDAPGKAFRLYTESAFRGLAAETVPEIWRCNLASTVLQLKALGVADVLGFDFLDPPPQSALLRSLELLYALGALDFEGELSKPLGRRMAALPVHPMYAKALLTAADTGCAAEALAVVAVVSSDAVFVNPVHKRTEAAAARARFISRNGDHATMLAVFRMYQQVDKGERKRWCSENFVSDRALRKAVDIHTQLSAQLSTDVHAAPNGSQHPNGSTDSPALKAFDSGTGAAGSTDAESTTGLRRALTAGLAMHGAMRQPDGTYRLLATNQLVMVHPSSVLSGRKAACIVFDELVQTARLYARNVTAIEPQWLPELAPQLFRSAPNATTQ